MRYFRRGVIIGIDKKGGVMNYAGRGFADLGLIYLLYAGIQVPLD